MNRDYHRDEQEVVSVFVRIPKTASTSIEHALRGNPAVMINSRADILPRDDWTRNWADRGLSNLWISALGADVWRGLTSFAFVRNPYDRAVSSWLHVRRMSSEGKTICREGTTLPKSERFPADSFAHFLSMLQARRLSPVPQWHATCQAVHVTDPEGSVNVDIVGRYENLQRDFDEICHRIGLTGARLPDLNKTRPTDMSYREYYRPELRRIVERIFGRDIETFGYMF